MKFYSFSIVWITYFSQLEHGTPFKRKIHQDELWLYRNPRTDSYVPSEVLWPFVLAVPCTVFFCHFLISRNKLEFIQANLAFSLALGLNGILTNVLKLCVGKHCIPFHCNFYQNNNINFFRSTETGFLLALLPWWRNERWNGMHWWWRCY